MKKEATVDLTIDLGALKSQVKRAARADGVTVNEFICNAVESRVRQEKDYGEHNFTPHGGKHLFGKHTGYEVTKDGKYYPASTWTDRFNQLFAERNAITNLANSVVKISQERLIEVEKQITETQKNLIDDLGLDVEKEWAYYGGAQMYIVEIKDEQATK